MPNNNGTARRRWAERDKVLEEFEEFDEEFKPLPCSMVTNCQGVGSDKRCRECPLG